MAKWKIEIKSVNGSYATVEINNSISDPNKMVSELGKGQVAMAFDTGENERTIFPYATIISIKVKKLEDKANGSDV